MNNNLLFVYGSLLDNGNEFGRYLKQHATLYSAGIFKGRLFDCGEYPAAIAATDSYDIKGSIYNLNNAEVALAVLDDYEGFGVYQEQPNLFIREPVAVDSGTGKIFCWIYLYNLPVNGLTEIPTGDYISYLNS